MEDQYRSWPPILGLGLFAALGFSLASLLGLPALIFGFPLLLLLRRPLPGSQAGGLLAPYRRAGGMLLGLGFFIGALAALEQGWTRWPPREQRQESLLVRFEGKLLRKGRETSFGQVEAPIQAGAEVLTLSMEGGELAKGSWIEGTARLVRRHGRAWLHTRASLCSIRVNPGESLRTWLRTALDEALELRLSSEVAMLVHRLLLGRSGQLPPRIERAHRKLGLSHLLAISGMHTLFLAAFLSWLLRPLGALLGGELRLMVPLLLGYAWLTGAQPPVLRAVLGFLFWRFCWTRGLPFDIGACLGFAALVSLVLAPGDFASVSFLLSFAATLALVCFFQNLRAGLQRLHAGKTIATLLAASIAAQIGTAALSLQTFGHLSPWGILATPLMLPLLFAMLALGMLLFLTLPIPGLASPVAFLLDLTGQAWLAFVQAVPALPAAPLRPLYLPPEDLTLALLLGLASLALLLRSKRALLLAFLLPVLPWFLPLGASRESSFTILPVGHGLCSVIQEQGRVLVFDCGDLREGKRSTPVLLARLRETGPARIQDLVLSHADQDHAAALPELLLRLRIDRLWIPESPKAAWIQHLLQGEGIELRILPPGARVRLRPHTLLLSPHEAGDLAGSNDGGLALYHRFAKGPDLLLTGDQEEAGTAALLRTTDLPGQLDLLVLPHHGSAGSRFETLVQRFQPFYCLASTGSRRPINRAHLDALTPGLPLLTTSKEGSIQIHKDKQGTWRIQTDRALQIPLRNP